MYHSSSDVFPVFISPINTNFTGINCSMLSCNSYCCIGGSGGEGVTVAVLVLLSISYGGLTFGNTDRTGCPKGLLRGEAT